MEKSHREYENETLGSKEVKLSSKLKKHNGMVYTLLLNDV